MKIQQMVEALKSNHTTSHQIAASSFVSAEKTPVLHSAVMVCINLPAKSQSPTSNCQVIIIVAFLYNLTFLCNAMFLIKTLLLS